MKRKQKQRNFNRLQFSEKNGHKWSTEHNRRQGRTASKNIVLRIPGNKGGAKNIQSEIEAWQLLCDDEMIVKIVEYTNMEINIQSKNYADTTKYCQQTSKLEISALIDLLYIAGTFKEAKLNVREMWSVHGPPVYRAIMGESRFCFLINCLRFDDKGSRNQNDKFAPIRDIWTAFISNCTRYYTPHEYCTIDEQLLGFRGKCPFRVYIASKPDKYGLKIITMCDSRTFYMINALPYIGKEVRNSNEPISQQYVREISSSIHGTGRNLTMDNWFTSVSLADKMLDEHKLTIVGTLRKNKAEIPHSFLPNRKKEVLSSQFAFDGEKTLVSFTPKKGKSVILVS